MAGEYKAACGCKIHVAQWTAKRKVVTQESCPLHKAAPKLLAACKAIRDGLAHDPTGPMILVRAAIAEAEGQS